MQCFTYSESRLNNFETNKIKIDTVIILQSKITQCHIIYIPLYYYWWIAWRGENFCTSRLWKCIWSCITIFKSFRTIRISLRQADDVCDRTFISLHYLLYKKIGTSYHIWVEWRSTFMKFLLRFNSFIFTWLLWINMSERSRFYDASNTETWNAS